MKLSKIFHFLYFAVLSIPLVSIPIFAIYSQNHEINDNTLQVQENLKIDNFNQVYKSQGDRTQTLCGDVTCTFDTFTISINGTMTSSSTPNGNRGTSYKFLANHWYILKCNVPTNLRLQQNYINNLGNQVGASVTNTSNTTKFLNYVESQYTTYVALSYVNGYEFDNLILTPQIFDLTQMGLENITTDEFNQLFLDYPYPYTESQEMFIENAYTTTYDDTDIMSQFIYQEYNFMDKYLGIYKYQPFAGIYSWIQNTFFNANAPLVFTIFYQWFAYWLFVSLCWLVFDVLIYVPMVAHRWLDKGALE